MKLNLIEKWLHKIQLWLVKDEKDEKEKRDSHVVWKYEIQIHSTTKTRVLFNDCVNSVISYPSFTIGTLFLHINSIWKYVSKIKLLFNIWKTFVLFRKDPHELTGWSNSDTWYLLDPIARRNRSYFAVISTRRGRRRVYAEGRGNFHA